MNGALVGAGWHKPEVLSLHPSECYSYICLGEEGGGKKKQEVCFTFMATFFFFFFKICHYCDFYWKLSQTQWIFWNSFCQTFRKKLFRLLSRFKYWAKYIYIYNVCLNFFLSLIWLHQFMDDCPQLHHQIGKKTLLYNVYSFQ